MAQLTSLTGNDTGNLTLPTGTNANRPSAPTTTVAQFTTTGAATWTCPAGVTNIEVLVVAGGGGGGSAAGGGGGGVIYDPRYPVVPTTVYNLSVGAGGAAATTSSSGVAGSSGTNSTFDLLTAIGGGGGGAYNTPNNAGLSGGSGGGGGSVVGGNAANLGGASTVGQGWKGGNGNASSNPWASGGGGGAGGAGYPATSGGYAGNGGPGIMCDITGTALYWGGGGGGGAQGGRDGTGNAGAGGVGGGGGGCVTYQTGTILTFFGGAGALNAGGNGNAVAGGTGAAAGAGGANTGGGGGGQGISVGASGAGGSGIVVIRYNTNTIPVEGQARFNTETKILETTISNKFRPVLYENIVKNGLVVHLDAAYYAGTGTSWQDLSGRDNHATITGSPAYSTNNGGYFTFSNGTNQYASNTNTFSAHVGATSMTICGWVRAPASVGDSYVASVGPATTGSARGLRQASQALSAVSYGSGGSQDFNSGGVLELNKWVYLCAVWNGPYVSIFINGYEVAKTNLTAPAALTAGNYTIGNNSWSPGGTYTWGGDIAMASIYTRPLSTQEIRQNFNATSARFGLSEVAERGFGLNAGQLGGQWPTPDLLWYDASLPKCYPGSGTTVNDLSGRGYTGSTTNITFGTQTFPTENGQVNTSYWIFNGTNSSINLGGNASSQLAWSPSGYINSTLTAFTIEMWVYSYDVNNAFFFSKPWNGSGQYNIWMTDWSFTCNGGNPYVSSGVSANNNPNWGWNHVVGHIDGTTIGYYLNGQGRSQQHGMKFYQDPPSGNAGVQPTLGSIYPGGSYGDNSLQFRGFISTCKMYSRVLTPVEIQNLFQSTRAKFGV